MHKIGIIGGGQLGKMMILDAKRLDDYFVILDPTLHCPAHSIADEHIVADFDDVAAIEELASKVDVVTYEFEHISVKALQQVEAKGCPVYPSSETLLHIQNKYDQKQWLMSHGLPVPDFRKADSYEQLVEDCDYFGYPVILKTCTGGYDGKGNAVIQGAQGRIVARVQRQYTASRPLTVRTFTYTGRSTERTTLYLPGYSHTEETGAPLRSAEMQTEWQPLRLGRLALPGCLCRVTSRERAVQTLTYPEETAAALALRDCRAQLLKEFPDAEIEAEQREISAQNQAVQACVTYIFTADIAARQ